MRFILGTWLLIRLIYQVLCASAVARAGLATQTRIQQEWNDHLNTLVQLP